MVVFWIVHVHSRRHPSSLALVVSLVFTVHTANCGKQPDVPTGSRFRHVKTGRITLRRIPIGSEPHPWVLQLLHNLDSARYASYSIMAYHQQSCPFLVRLLLVLRSPTY